MSPLTNESDWRSQSVIIDIYDDDENEEMQMPKRRRKVIKHLLRALLLLLFSLILGFILFLFGNQDQNEHEIGRRNQLALGDVQCALAAGSIRGAASVVATAVGQTLEKIGLHEALSHHFGADDVLVPEFLTGPRKGVVLKHASQTVQGDAAATLSQFAQEEWSTKTNTPTRKPDGMVKVAVRDVTITANKVTEQTKQFIPSLEECGFAFKDISESPSFDATKYSKMMDRMQKEAFAHASQNPPFRLSGKHEVTLSEDEEALLLGIFDDFAKENDLRIAHRSLPEVFVGRSSGTGIHFDEFLEEKGDETILVRLWVPLANHTPLPLIVGDASSYWNKNQSLCNVGETLNHCAVRHKFQDIKWYEQEMDMTDGIFWNLDKVIHGTASDRGHDRAAMVVDLEFERVQSK